MAILWDAPLTASVARELHERLAGARVRALRMDRRSRNLLLYFRESTLVFRLHPLRGDVALLGARKPDPEAKKLKARVREVTAPPDERLLLVQMQPAAAGTAPEGIAVELMTNQWNAVWLDVGTDRIRQVLWRREREKRPLVPGETYRPPPSSDRRGIAEPLGVAEWLDLLAPLEPRKRKGALLRSVAFTSSLNVPALLGQGESADPEGGGPERASDDPERAPDERALREGYRLWLKLREVSLGERRVRPVQVDSEKGPMPYPLTLPPWGSDPRESLLQAFEDSAAGDDEDEGERSVRAALLPSSLVDRLDREIEGARRRVSRLEEELRESPDPGSVRAVGDLILARFHEVERGADAVTLEGFDGEPVTVRLDPSLSADENARRYYDDAARAERARSRLPDLIAEARRRIAELEDLREGAGSGELTAEALEQALPEPREGRGGAKGRPRGAGGGDERKLPYRTYRSSGGLEIRVGRGARANDELTFHHSNPDDVWLHARQVTGAHVILRWPGDGNPPARDLAQAASLAAFHSDARHAGSVPVDWTRRKYVRSPRKAPPGAVVPDRVQTLFVDPDAGLEKKLRK